MIQPKLEVRKLQEYKRILKLARRPGKEEFFRISEISGIIIALIGMLGFFHSIFY